MHYSRIVQMSELTALITGANKGIGLALTQQLSALKFKIFAVCRNTSTELNSVDLNQGCIVENIDLSDPSCNLDPLKVAVGSASINWLINNAGILSVENFDETLDFDAVRKQFEVNSIGPIRVTNALKANLIHNSKVFIISSRMGSVSDNSSGGMYGYRMSKAAVNMAGKSLAVDLKPSGISVHLLHPGMVKTDMTKRWGQGISTEESAAGLITQIQSSSMENTGNFKHMNGEELPW